MSAPALGASDAYVRLRASIAGGRCVVLDGGVATELEHRHGQQNEALWGVEALVSSPSEVVAVHRRYVEAGADVITTNTWGLMTALEAPGNLSEIGIPALPWMDVARRGVEAAQTAIAEGDARERCATAFSLNADVDAPDGEEVASLLVRALAGARPDLLLVETLSLVRPSLLNVVEALIGSGIPVWLSFRRCREGLCGVYGQHWGGPEGDSFGRAARRFEEMGVEALLVNCIPPDHVPGMLTDLRDYTDLPLGVYPNLGYLTSAGWQSETAVDGPAYAAMALGWRAEGAQIIGGCCGTRPEHIAAASAALAGTRAGVDRVPRPRDPSPPLRPAATGRSFADPSGRSLAPLPFPVIEHDRTTTTDVDGAFLLWKHLFERRVGAQRRCLDIGSGAGLQTVQLALNGAAHVHAIDSDAASAASALDNAFRNGVADRVTASVDDLFAWLPAERYEVIVAHLPQTPVDPAGQTTSHRPVDFWGRGLFDHVIVKLSGALAPEGVAVLTMSSLLSRRRTDELLARHGLVAAVVDWGVRRARWATDDPHVDRVERLSDAYRLRYGGEAATVCYVLEIRRADESAGDRRPWTAHS